MFTNTIDKKKIINDQNGNEIVDFTTSIFNKSARGIDTYNTIRMIDYFQMRPDKVSINEYKSDDYTEYILKYSGISNPFSLKDDDLLVIPDIRQADNQMQDFKDAAEDDKQDQVRLYYKYTNTDFKSDSTSYDKLANKVIPSGVLDPTDNGEFMVPYISDDGETAITIKNGRMYFGNYALDSNNATSSTTSTELLTLLDQKCLSLLTLLDQKCLSQGMSLTDFVRAGTKNSVQTQLNNLSNNNITLDDINNAYNNSNSTYNDIMNNYLSNI